MSAFEQLSLIKEAIKTTQDPAILFAMNQKARELESEIEKIKTLEVIICNN